MDNKFDNIVNTFFGQLIIFLSTCGNQQVSIPLNLDKQPEKHDVYRIEYQKYRKTLANNRPNENKNSLYVFCVCGV